MFYTDKQSYLKFARIIALGLCECDMDFSMKRACGKDLSFSQNVAVRAHVDGVLSNGIAFC